MTSRRIQLRYATTCSGCSAPLGAGAPATWDGAAKRATCDGCAGIELELGVAGRSAAREATRRRSNREQRVRAAHPRLGGLVLALGHEPQSTTSWQTGAHGERLVGARLDELAPEGVLTLHDLRIPGSRANIDHIAVAPSGVYVIDAKEYSGEPHQRDKGSFFRADLRLYVGRRDCTKLVGAVKSQAARVRAVLPGVPAVEVFAGLAFVADWPLLSRTFTIDGAWVGWPRALRKYVARQGPLSAEDVHATARRIAAAFPPA